MIKTLYGLDKKGGFKLWTVEVEKCDRDFGLLKISHGKEGGKMTLKSETFVEGKQGRTAFEQAVFEAQARIKKQLDKNYRENKDDLQEIDILAMLAADYRKQGHRIEYPCYGSVKYDGVRALAKKRGGVVTIESRTSQLYDLPHLQALLTIHMQDGDIWDGEIYKHGYELQDIVSAVKRTDPQKEIDKAKRAYDKNDTEENEAAVIEAILVSELRDKLEFHIFDVVSDKTFKERVEDLDTLCGIPVVSPHIQITQYLWIADEADMKAKHKVAVEQGYEGIMLRNFKGVYESGKRSADLQKYKEFLDSEFVIVNVLPNKDQGSAFLVLNDLNEERFSVTLGSMAERAKFLENKEEYVGKLLTVSYQTRYKGTLLPQFPTGVAIRDYE
jgi:DNA ligase-1